MNTSLQEHASQHPFLKSMSPEHAELATKNAHEEQYEEGEVIFSEGEPANRLFLIETGRVLLETRAESGETVRVQVLGPGDVLGWSWLFPPFSWHFTARTVEPTRMTVLDGGHLLVAAEDDTKFGYDMMRCVAQLVITRLQATRKKILPTS